MYSSFKEFFLTVFASSHTVNFSAFMQMLTTVAAAIYGFFSLNQWMKQKSIEKQSDYAEESLNFLDLSHEAIIELLCRPKLSNWYEKFAKAKAEFGQARRKAHRIDDAYIDQLYRHYDKILKSIEENHTTCVDDISCYRLKANADDMLSKSIDTLKSIYKQLYPALVNKSLIKVSQ